MAVAARVDPKSYFTAEEWAPLARRSAWMGLALVAHCWAVIGLCWVGVIAASHYLGWLWPLTLILAVPIIGGRQLGLVGSAADPVLEPPDPFADALAELGQPLGPEEQEEDDEDDETVGEGVTKHAGFLRG